jgi:NAD(P)-dependent dehydrogenase (short-subunit alcohol dehydrogenase family)
LKPGLQEGDSEDGMPEDVANVAVFLASRRSDWVTGVTIDVNAGILIR